jgi:hypothetical protein
LVTERFTRRGYDSFGPNHIGKSIVKLANTKAAGFCHIIQTDGPMLNDGGELIDQAGSGIHTGFSHRFLALNHYYTKSWEEWQTRRAAGKADKSPDAADFRRTDDDFRNHDQNVCLDLRALQIAQLMKPIYYPGILNAPLVSAPRAPASLWT